jgi:hypothetical protein
MAGSIAPEERSDIPSDISGTMRQFGVALGFAGLDAIPARRTAQPFSRMARDLGLPADHVSALTARVVNGDTRCLPDGQPTPWYAKRTSKDSFNRLISLRTLEWVSGFELSPPNLDKIFQGVGAGGRNRTGTPFVTGF